MNELKVLEDGIVPVYETDTGEKVVDGRELWENLQSKQQFTDWVRERLNECDAIENADYEVFQKNMKNSKGGRPSKEYIIKLSTAKEMAMLERNAIGKKVRKYFIAIEERYNSQLSFPTLSPELKAIFLHDQKIIHVETKVNKLETSVEYLENTMTIDYGQQYELNSLAKTVVVDHLGGKKSNAYKILNRKAFQSMWRDYKAHFVVNSYKNTPAVRYDEAAEYILNWVPDYNLKLEIDNANAVIKLNEVINA